MNHKEDTEQVDLNSLAELVGFPVELVKKELFNDKDFDGEVDLGTLRAAMIKYLDATMLED